MRFVIFMPRDRALHDRCLDKPPHKPDPPECPIPAPAESHTSCATDMCVSVSSLVPPERVQVVDSEARKLEVRGLDLRLSVADLPRTATGGCRDRQTAGIDLVIRPLPAYLTSWLLIEGPERIITTERPDGPDGGSTPAARACVRR